MSLNFFSETNKLINTFNLLEREFDVFVLTPIFYRHIESGTAFRTFLVGNLDTAHHNNPSLRLYGDLIGHVEIERLEFPDLQAHFKIQPVTAFGTCRVVFVRVVRYAERLDAGLCSEIFHATII